MSKKSKDQWWIVWTLMGIAALGYVIAGIGTIGQMVYDK